MYIYLLLDIFQDNITLNNSDNYYYGLREKSHCDVNNIQLSKGVGETWELPYLLSQG